MHGTFALQRVFCSSHLASLRVVRAAEDLLPVEFESLVFDSETPRASLIKPIKHRVTLIHVMPKFKEGTHGWAERGTKTNLEYN